MSRHWWFLLALNNTLFLKSLCKHWCTSGWSSRRSCEKVHCKAPHKCSDHWTPTAVTGCCNPHLWPYASGLKSKAGWNWCKLGPVEPTETPTHQHSMPMRHCLLDRQPRRRINDLSGNRRNSHVKSIVSCLLFMAMYGGALSEFAPEDTILKPISTLPVYPTHSQPPPKPAGDQPYCSAQCKWSRGMFRNTKPGTSFLFSLLST